jgi:methionine-rich copper-binding protein CopC
MKALLISTFLALGMMGFAQHGPHQKGMKDMSPEQQASLETKKLTLALDLSENQQEQIQEIHLEKALAREAKKEERATRESKPNADERYAHMSERLDRQIEVKEQMKDILNKEQYQKWERLQLGREIKGKCKSHRGKPSR